jgi:hypothetical protein
MRVAIGTVTLVLGLALYSLLMMRLGAAVLPEHWGVQALFYGVAGLVWVWPAARLTRWVITRPPSDRRV